MPELKAPKTLAEYTNEAGAVYLQKIEDRVSKYADQYFYTNAESVKRAINYKNQKYINMLNFLKQND